MRPADASSAVATPDAPSVLTTNDSKSTLNAFDNGQLFSMANKNASSQQIKEWDQFSVYGSPVSTMNSNHSANDPQPTEWDDFGVYGSPMTAMSSMHGNVIIPNTKSNMTRQAATINRGTSAGGNNLESNVMPNIQQPLAKGGNK